MIDGHNDVTSWMLDYGFDLGMDGAADGKRTLRSTGCSAGCCRSPRATSCARTPICAACGPVAWTRSSSRSSPHSDYAETPGASRQRALDMIDALLAQIRRHADRLELAGSAEDIRRIAASGRIAALMGLEGGHAIENDLANLRDFHARGVRYVTLTWSNTNDWADSSATSPATAASPISGARWSAR